MLLLVAFYMYIIRMSVNCHIHDVHMRQVLKPHDELQFNFCVIVASFTC